MAGPGTRESSTNGSNFGALNLLLNCVGVESGQRVLLVTENPEEGYYEEIVALTVRHEAEALGARVSTITSELISEPDQFPVAVSDAMQRADHTIFLNRLGDYSRFVPLAGSRSKTICYVLDKAMMDSPFAETPHQLMTKLRRRLEFEITNARAWRITCPLGTDISGTFCWPSRSGKVDDDFTLTLFPVTTFKPVPADTATGQVAISRWLMSGGATKYGPPLVRFDEVVTVDVDHGMIQNFRGAGAGVGIVRNHYDTLSRALKVNRDRVHSWHAGVNPLTFFPQPADEDPVRWGGVSFGSPRYLHFHTCGDVPPGEIAWSIFNPTVWIDDVLYWRDGEFVWLHRPDNSELISLFPGAECLLQPSWPIGI